jgi:CheY-like chemotaxis protein
VLDQRDRRVFALVVDDSITVRRVTQRLLERNGMRVLTAKDGMDAVSLLQENMPDIILLDIEMPRMDGYEVAAHVRNDPRLKHIPIVMITSRVSEKHRARAIELGVNDYLGKPYQESQLLDAIEPLVSRRGAVARLGPEHHQPVRRGRRRAQPDSSAPRPCGIAGGRRARHRRRRAGARAPGVRRLSACSGVAAQLAT